MVDDEPRRTSGTMFGCGRQQTAGSDLLSSLPVRSDRDVYEILPTHESGLIVDHKRTGTKYTKTKESTIVVSSVKDSVFHSSTLTGSLAFNTKFCPVTLFQTLWTSSTTVSKWEVASYELVMKMLSASPVDVGVYSGVTETNLDGLT